MKNILFVILAAGLLFFSRESQAQNNNVGIGTTTPVSSAMLDVTSTTKGVLVPRVTTSQMNAISSPANGLMVYNTDSSCFFFYKSLTWTSLCMPAGAGATGATGPTGPAGTAGTPGVTGPTGPSQTAWWIVGNAGTTAATNFIGTTDANDLVTKTNTIERMRVTSPGGTVVNKTAPQAGDVFSVYGTGAPAAISNLGDYAISGYVSGTGSGIFGQNLGAGSGVVGVSTSGNGVVGQANGTVVTGVSGRNTNTAGTGIIAIGNNTAGTVITGGSGLAANGTNFGLFATAATVANGTGVSGVGNGIAGANTLTTGSGLAGTGFLTGVYGLSSSTTGFTDRAGGYFQTSAGGSFAYVGFLDNTNVARKIAGNGVVSTIVKDLKNNLVFMACPEAPENLFEDYGKGMLTNGTAHITIDPIFSKNIVVNEQHDLRVFIQLEGDCQGVFVTNKTQYGFDVVELQGGKSNVRFSWHVVANRADEVLPDGTLSKYSSGRFSPAPGPIPNVKTETVPVEFPRPKGVK